MAATLISTIDSFPTTPLQIPGLVAADAGSSFVLALKENGLVTNLETGFPAMNPPAGLSNVTAISISLETALALTSAGNVVAWGDNAPKVPSGLSNVAAIATGNDFSCLALRRDGTVANWGSYTNMSIGLSNVVAIAAGTYGNFAVRANGTVAAWGSQAAVPLGLSNVLTVSCGRDESAIALLASGAVVGWNGGSLLVTNLLPASATNTVAIAGDMQSILALQADGSVVIGGTAPPSFPTTLSNVYALGQITLNYETVVEGEGFPVFTVQPGGQTVAAGDSIYLHARVIGLPSAGSSYEFQWQLGGTNVPGATGEDLIITNATAADAGNYQAVITFDFGFDTIASYVAAVTVLPPTAATLLAGPILQPDGSFLITANGPTGQPFPLTASTPFVLQASSDLINWVTLTNGLTLTNGAIDFTDPAAASSPSRFYRLVGQ